MLSRTTNRKLFLHYATCFTSGNIPTFRDYNRTYFQCYNQALCNSELYVTPRLTSSNDTDSSDNVERLSLRPEPLPTQQSHIVLTELSTPGQILCPCLSDCQQMSASVSSLSSSSWMETLGTEITTVIIVCSEVTLH